MMDEELFKSSGVTINAEVVNIAGDVVGRDKTALAPLGASAPVEVEPVFRALVIISRPLDVSELPAIADQWELVRGLAGVEAPVRVKVLGPPARCTNSPSSRRTRATWPRQCGCSRKA